MTQALAIRIGSTSSSIFDVTRSAISNERTLDPPAGSTGWGQADFSFSNRYLLAGFSSSDVWAALEWNDGNPGDWGTPIAAGGSAAWVAPHTTEETIFAVGEFGTPDVRILRVHSDLSITQIDTLTVTGSTYSGCSGSWNSAGDRLAFGTDSSVILASWDGSTLTEVDSLSVFPGGSDRVSPHFAGDTTRIFVGNENHTQIVLVDSAGDTLTSLDTESQSNAFGHSAVAPNGLYAFHGTRQSTDDPRIWMLNESSFGAATTFPTRVPYAGAWVGNDRLVTMDDELNDIEVTLWSWDGSSLELLSQQQISNATRVFIVTTNGTPPTAQQQFSASYADVSGRDPLPTALTQRTPAQRLVNYLVSLYAGTNPRIVTKPIQIELGELDKTSPAPASGDLSRQIWIEDDRDPNFVGGRWATILGRSGGSEPGTVTLTLFIADNDESFVEPT